MGRLYQITYTRHQTIQRAWTRGGFTTPPSRVILIAVMPEKYPFKDIEPKWQQWWEAHGTYRAKDPGQTDAEKYYGLVEFPYPSGEGLHVGHPRSYTAIDIMTRKKRMEGRNVMYPMGWDAFGLPAENFAIKNKKHPAEFTVKNAANFKRQIKLFGTGFDWSREINTTDPGYYRWTQWMFVQFFESWYDETMNVARPIATLYIPEEIETKGEIAVREYRDSKRLAFKTKTTINWCPKDKIGLANEEAVGGICDRCGGPVEKRVKEQWMLRITAYADRLINDLNQVDYLEKIKTQQVNWIGRSEGALIRFRAIPLNLPLSREISEHINNPLEKGGRGISVFTTRPDTLFGATYMVLAPEHQLVTQWLEDGTITNAKEVKAYQSASKKKTDIERQENKEKTGVQLKGVLAINPANQKEIPIWIADYVLSDYGTGAIMAVPAHDERDHEFAEKFKLEIITVVQGGEDEECFAGEGVAVNSDFLDGLETKKAKDKIITWLEKNEIGERKVNFKLRDWVFSRQRYWGEPIPMVYCDHCGWVPLNDKDLPLLLPDVENYEPTDTGDSPLAAMTDWVKVKCPICGAEARRETDTMPGWAGSSWYFLRYCDPKNTEAFASPEALKYWMPVDLYNGGMEHTTLHLLYSRFWYKFLFDRGFVPSSCGSEPYKVRRSHAMILGEGGIKMSKSKGNVVNPDDMIGEYGSDVFRMYEMFIGPYDTDAPWSTHGIQGVRRFLDKVWNFSQSQIQNSKFKIQNEDAGRAMSDVERLLHQSIKKVGEDIDGMHFNTAVSQLMILTNELLGQEIGKRDFESYLRILAPFAPHITEELWHELGHEDSIHLAQWPAYDPEKTIADVVTVAVQVNGKVRGQIQVAIDEDELSVRAKAETEPNVKKYLDGKTVKKAIYVKGKIISFVAQGSYGKS